MKKIVPFLCILFLIAGVGLIPSQARSEGGSYVIGRIQGTHQPLPTWFRGSESLSRQGIEEVELMGFNLLRKTDGKKFFIRPNQEGYFRQALPGGDYTLIRERRDKPNYKEENRIDILEFNVPPGSLVNIGTIDLVFQGKPEESLWDTSWGTQGTYIYHYGYGRKTGAESYTGPLDWFKSRKPKIARELASTARKVQTLPATTKDSSKVVLEDRELPPGM